MHCSSRASVLQRERVVVVVKFATKADLNCMHDNAKKMAEIASVLLRARTPTV